MENDSNTQGVLKMVRPIMRDPLFLAGKSEPTTEADKQVVISKYSEKLESIPTSFREKEHVNGIQRNTDFCRIRLESYAKQKLIE